MRFVIVAFLTWRILLFIPLYFGIVLLPLRQSYVFSPIANFFLSPWANFDGIHYLTIADVGYTTEANFLPVFPIIIRGLVQFFGYFFSGLIIANISFLLALIILYKLILFDYSKTVAKQAIIFLLLFPTSFYFASIYSESLFLLLIVCSFYLSRQNKWFLASVLSSIASATRLTGILMFPVLIYDSLKRKGYRFSLSLLSLFLIPLGLISYVFFNLYKWGDAFYFIKAHGNLANSRSVDQIILFPQTIFRYIKILTFLPFSYYEWWISLFELITFFLFTTLIIFSWKKIKTSYLIFVLLSFLIPVSSGTFSALPRYVLTLFPLFISFALIKKRSIKLIYFIVSPILLFILLMLFSRGYFVA